MGYMRARPANYSPYFS